MWVTCHKYVDIVIVRGGRAVYLHTVVPVSISLSLNLPFVQN